MHLLKEKDRSSRQTFIQFNFNMNIVKPVMLQRFTAIPSLSFLHLLESILVRALIGFWNQIF